MVLLKCPQCNHEWNFTGKFKRYEKVTCPKPRCKNTFVISDEKLTEYIKEKNSDKGGLTLEILKKSITNSGPAPSGIYNAEIEVVFRLFNPGRTPIKITRIILESLDSIYYFSLDKYEELIDGKKCIVDKFDLNQDQVKIIRFLSLTNSSIPKRAFIQANIKFFGIRNEQEELIKEKKVRLTVKSTMFAEDYLSFNKTEF